MALWLDDAVLGGRVSSTGRIPANTSGPPLVSVLMTVHNGMPYLPQAVQSILGQSHRNLQLVVVDDGSTDATHAHLRAVRGRDDRVVIVRNRQCQGTAVAANRGLEFCTGEFTARMDADDVALPDRLAVQVAALRRRPDVGLIGAFTRQLGEAKVGGVVPLPVGHPEIVAALLAGRHALSHPTLMMRTEILKGIGGYWSYPLVDDWDMMLRMGEQAKLANIPTPLLHYRVHRQSLNGSDMRRMRLSIDFARARAAARRRGAPEPEFESFVADRKEAPVAQRLMLRAEAMSLSCYRNAVAESNGRRPWRAAPYLALAGALRPDYVVQRLRRHRAAVGVDASAVVGPVVLDR